MENGDRQHFVAHPCEVLTKVSQLVVQSGYKVARKKPGEALRAYLRAATQRSARLASSGHVSTACRAHKDSAATSRVPDSAASYN